MITSSDSDLLYDCFNLVRYEDSSIKLSSVSREWVIFAVNAWPNVVFTPALKNKVTGYLDDLLRQSNETKAFMLSNLHIERTDLEALIERAKSDIQDHQSVLSASELDVIDKLSRAIAERNFELIKRLENMNESGFESFKDYMSTLGDDYPLMPMAPGFEASIGVLEFEHGDLDLEVWMRAEYSEISDVMLSMERTTAGLRARAIYVP